jgi:hypothetical protein
MKNITTSASKVAFLMLMGTACVAFLWGIFTGTQTFDPKDFMVLASGAAAYYFAYKGSPTDPSTGISSK